MADFLDENFGAETYAVDIDDLVQGTPLPVIQLPQGAARNRAATTALLSEYPSQAVSNYQTMMQENAATGGSSAVNLAQDNVRQRVQNTDMQGMMSVLSDVSIPMDVKKQALSGIQTSQFLKDTSTILLTDSLAKPSAGQNKEQEDARISTAEAVSGIYKARNDVQGLVNAHAASLQSDKPLQTLDEMGEVWIMPFGNNINAGKIKSALDKEQGKGSVWRTMKNFLLAGTSTADMRKQLESLPPEKRAEFAQKLINVISKNSGILFSNDNQFAQFDKATSIFGEGGYSSTQEFLDNVSPLLDIIGFGQLTRGGGKVAKVAGTAEKVGDVIDVESRLLGYTRQLPAPSPRGPAPKTVQPEDLATVTGRPTVGAYDDHIAALQAERAELLGDVPSNLSKGEVASLQRERAAITKPPSDVAALAKEIQARDKITSKEAKKRAEKEFKDANAEYEARVGRIDQMLGQNRGASTTSQRVDQLDKEIAQLEKANTPVFAKLNPIADAARRVEMRASVFTENPASAAKTVQQANPEMARTLHAAVVRSPGEEAAEGLYGTSKVDAVASDVMPQVATESGRVTSKVANIDAKLLDEMVPEQIKQTIHNTGATYFTREEKAAVRANVVNDFRAAEGLAINDAMSGFTTVGGRVKIGAVYGSGDGGFVNAEQAVEQAKLALRNYGIRDDEIELLAKDGLDHVPVNLDDVRGIEGNYYVRVNTTHEVDPTDVLKAFEPGMEHLKVKWNWFDRLPTTVSDTGGSWSRNIMGSAAMLDPTYTRAASVVSDRSALLEKQLSDVFKGYSEKFAKLDPARQEKMNLYIREANYNQIKMDDADLIGRGFTPYEINTLKNWKSFWDTHFYLENNDVVRTLNAQGYQVFKNNQTELYAKPIAKNQNLGYIYDPSIDDVVLHSKAEGDIFYAAGGTYAKLRRPVTFNGTTTEYMMARQTPNEFLRKLRDTDQVLNYRDGYFQLQYKAPRFVDQVEVDATGRVINRKAIAVAGNTKEAELFADRMATSQGLPRDSFVIRADDRAMRIDSDTFWDVHSATGRIAQRHRGKLLEDSSGLNHLGDGSYILDPVESGMRAARSISGRTVARPMLEAAKARFMNQYASMLPSNGMGGVQWPRSVRDIGTKGGGSTSDVADARTTFEYINYLENGYINSLDEIFKQGFHALADYFGAKGASTLEEMALKASEQSINSLAKGSVFTSYIVANPLRQWIIQPHQVVRTYAYNPIGWANFGIQRLSSGYLWYKAGNANRVPAFAKFLDDSGMIQAIDQSNLARSVLRDAADSSNKVVKAVATVRNKAQVIGFDSAEAINLVGHAAAVFERRTRQGQDLAGDLVARDEAYGEIRALSGDMNFAGDFPYNQTSAAMVMQFLQVPMKMLLQPFNRALDPKKRAALVAGDMFLFGTPIALVGSVIGSDILPENKELRDTLTEGFLSVMYNNIFSLAFDDKDTAHEDRTDIDWSALQPYDLQGWGKFLTNVMTGGVAQVFMNSPAGQLWVKDGGRINNAMAMMMRYFNPFTDEDEDAPTFLDVTNEVAKVASGWNNYQKARIALDTKKRYDQYGNTIDPTVTSAESVMMAFGFDTTSTRDMYEMSTKLGKDIKTHREDTIKAYNDIKRYYTTKLQEDNADVKYITKVTGAAMKAFEGDPVAMGIIRSEMHKDFTDKNTQLMGLLMKRAGILSTGGLKDLVNRSPLTPEEKDILLQRIEDVDATRAEWIKEKD